MILLFREGKSETDHDQKLYMSKNKAKINGVLVGLTSLICFQVVLDLSLYSTHVCEFSHPLPNFGQKKKKKKKAKTSHRETHGLSHEIFTKN